MNQQQTVLLTGSRGFTGCYVREILESRGYRVIGLVQGNPVGSEVAADLQDEVGLRDAIRMAQPDYVIHLAAIAFVAHSDPMAFYRVNLFGTLNLLQSLAAESSGVKKVILSSSANIYGANPVSPVPESSVPAPVNHYAMSKLAMEHMALTYCDKLPIVITRPFNYTGRGQDEKFLIPKIVSHFKERKAIIRLGNLDVEREFNDVRMVSLAYLSLMEKAEPGLIVNLCSGNSYSLTTVISMMQDITGHRIDVEVDPLLVRPNELKVLVGNPARLKQYLPDLGSYSFQDTLKEMLR